MTLQERYMLLKRPIIESVNDIFTSVFDLEHSRHRNPNNALTHMISCVFAYCFYPDKLSKFAKLKKNCRKLLKIK
jgi:hypothetical protein